ncbi:hypothetical protein PO909_002133 [Leuciscus waleckii]
MVLTARVRHSQRTTDPFLVPWLIAEKSGIVICGHCTCMAGLGEVCSHVSALLFAIEATVKLRNSKTVTQEKSYWLLPSAIKKVIFFFCKCFKSVCYSFNQITISKQTKLARRNVISKMLAHIVTLQGSRLRPFLENVRVKMLCGRICASAWSCTTQLNSCIELVLAPAKVLFDR